MNSLVPFGRTAYTRTWLIPSRSSAHCTVSRARGVRLLISLRWTSTTACGRPDDPAATTARAAASFEGWPPPPPIRYPRNKALAARAGQLGGGNRPFVGIQRDIGEPGEGGGALGMVLMLVGEQDGGQIRRGHGKGQQIAREGLGGQARAVPGPRGAGRAER